MPVIKEVREFFLRAIKVSTGTKPDQESNYPVSYIENGITKFNRFLKGHFPSKGVYEKLFESITFKLNKEDTASLTQQGLVKIATDANASSRTSNASNDFTAAVVPHQLPEIVLTDDAINDTVVSTTTVGSLTIKVVNRAVASVFRRVYIIKSSSQKFYLRADFDKISSTALTPIGTGGNFLTATLEAGKYYKFEAVLFVTCALAGLKYALSGTATFTDLVAIVEHSDTATDTMPIKGRFSAFGVGIGANGGAGSPGNGLTVIKGSILCLTAGTLSIDFAQNASGVTTSSVNKGSHFTVEEI